MVLPLQERYVNLLTDFGFKRVFGSEPNKRLVVDFLNTLLPEHHQIEDVSYRNSENQGHSASDRKAIFDIYCQSTKGERFIVEIQKAKQNYFKDRSVYYASFPIQEQAIKGEWDYRQEPVYSIGILDFTFDGPIDNEPIETDHAPRNDEAVELPAYLHIVDLKNQHCQVFYDKLRFLYVELPRYNKTLNELDSQQDKWLYLLRHLPDLADRPSPFQDPVFLELFEVAEIAKFSRDEQETYERSLKYYRDMDNVVNTSKAVGIEEGIEIGINIGEQRGIEIGERSLLLRQIRRKLGELPDTVVDQITSLSAAGLDALSNDIFTLDTLDALQQWLTIHFQE